MLRTATPSDAQAIATLHTRNWQTSYRGTMTDHYLDHEAPAERLEVWTERFSSPNQPMQVAVTEQENSLLMGFVCVFPNHSEEDGHLLDNLHVDAAFRGLGLGKKLMQYAAHSLLNTGYYGKIYLWVLTSNISAIGFYEKLAGQKGRTEIHDFAGNQKTEAMMMSWDVAELATGFEPSPT